MRKRLRRKYRRRRTLNQCYCCAMGYPCEDQGARLPRKDKKRLKKFISLGFVQDYGMGIQYPAMDSCNPGRDYKKAKKLFVSNNYYFRYEQAIKFLMHASEGGDGMSFDQNFKLGYNWEDDNGLYCTSGIEPLHFEQKGRMWMFDELQEILNPIKLDISTVKNERELLAAIRAMLRAGKIWMIDSEEDFYKLAEQIEEGLPVRKPSKKKLRRPPLAVYINRYGTRIKNEQYPHYPKKWR